MDLNEMIRAVQAALGVEVDGRPGPETWGAIYAALVHPKIQGRPPAQAIATVDERSERAIVTLLPEVQPMARALVHKAAAAGITIKVLSGLRSFAEQDALYAQGRTAPGPKVTHARGGHSNHNFGIAFDIGVFSGSSYLPDSPKYKAVGVLGTAFNGSGIFGTSLSGVAISSSNVAAMAVYADAFICSARSSTSSIVPCMKKACSGTSSSSPSITWPSLYSVRLMRWSVSRPCGKL